jgi:hypothetical protein
MYITTSDITSYYITASVSYFDDITTNDYYHLCHASYCSIIMSCFFMDLIDTI